MRGWMLGGTGGKSGSVPSVFYNSFFVCFHSGIERRRSWCIGVFCGNFLNRGSQEGGFFFHFCLNTFPDISLRGMGLNPIEAM
jgi:hypothetical protein